MRKKKIIMIAAAFFVLYPLTHGYGGFSGDGSSSRNTFKYDIKGEIRVAPTHALFPITIATRAATFQSSLKSGKKLLSRLEKDVGRLDPTRFTITPANFDKSYEYSKFSISFFGNDKTLSKTNLEFFLRIHFSDEHTFWERAKWIAEALDVLQRYGDEFKEDKMVEFHHGEMRLRVENKERYREQIVNTLYVKARRVADAIAAHENTTPAIKEMSCTQSIREEILNIHKASLSLDATILFEFTGRSIQEQNP